MIKCRDCGIEIVNKIHGVLRCKNHYNISKRIANSKYRAVPDNREIVLAANRMYRFMARKEGKLGQGRERIMNRSPYNDKKEIAEIYKITRELNLTVDHILPIVHPLICGLHVACNLQILTLEENLKKHNSFIPYQYTDNHIVYDRRS